MKSFSGFAPDTVKVEESDLISEDDAVTVELPTKPVVIRVVFAEKLLLFRMTQLSVRLAI